MFLKVRNVHSKEKQIYPNIYVYMSYYHISFLRFSIILFKKHLCKNDN